MANHVSKSMHMKDDQMQKWQTMCPTDTYTERMQMELYASTHTLSIYHMLNITFLANDIIYNNLY